MKIIISIPAFNEEKTLPLVIKEIREVMGNTSYDYDILVLDDGSLDETANVAKKLGALVISNNRNKGLAYTFKRELKECIKAGADIIVHTDADGQYPAKYIPRMISEVESGNDLVLGSRFIRNTYSGSFSKNFGNRAFACVISSLTGIKISDSTTGFRAFTKEVAEEISFINTFTYTQEQIIKASQKKFRIKEIPITTNKTRKSRLFGSPFEYALKAWVNILRIYRDYDPLKFFGYIGGVLFLFALVFAFWIVITFIQTSQVGGIPRVILCALFFITALQIWLFGFLADMLTRID